MGLITSSTATNQAKLKHKQLKAKLLEEAKKPKQRVVKLLLYGAGEAGKTTILRQMRLAKGDKLAEMKSYRGMICMNVIEGAAATIRAGKHYFGKKMNDANSEYVIAKYKSFLAKIGRTGAEQPNLNDSRLVDAIRNLLDDDDFKYVLDRRAEYQIPDCWEYFAHKLGVHPGWPTWGGPEWNPDSQDFLHSRIRTTGRSHVNFEIDDNHFQLIDIGGQRAERQKFFHLFDAIDAVLFVASISEYDQNLFENRNVNRLSETIRLWENTVNNSACENAWFVLFFNKFDLFKNKFLIKGVPITTDFTPHAPPPKPNEDDEHCSKALLWYEDLFMSKVHSVRKKNLVRVYNTTALDKEDIVEVMEFYKQTPLLLCRSR